MLKELKGAQMTKKKRLRGNKNINRIKSHKFPQGNYKIHWKKPYKSEGLCTDPNDRQIWINPNILDDRDLMRVILDESFHATMWEIDNDVVAEFADDMAEFLYRVGYRLEKKVEKPFDKSKVKE
jgi:hypothetical protein